MKGLYRAFAALCVLYLCAVQAIAAGNYHYSFFDEQVPLTEASGWIAVKLRTGTEPELFDLIEQLYAVHEQRDAGVPGWSLWRLGWAGDVAAIISDLTGLDGERAYYFAPVFRGRGPNPGITGTIPGESVLVRWRDDHDGALAEELLPTGCSGGNVLEPEPFGGMTHAYRIEPGCHSGLDLLEFANRLAQREEVVFAEPDMLVGGLQRVTPGDPLYSESWGLNNEGQTGGMANIDINAPEAWDITTGGPGAVALVIDDGVAQDHGDIGQVTPGADFTGQGSNGAPVNRCDNHGTAVAGAITALIDGNGTVGVAPGARSVSARTFISDVPESPSEECTGRWTTQFSWTVDALDWAASQGIPITNNSNSYDSRSSAIADKYRETREAGMIHFASAGNNASGDVNFPADLPSVNAVAAIDDTGALAEFSNYGSELSFALPGVRIPVTDRPGSDGYHPGDYVVLDGTSFASPMAAGVAALLFTRADNLTGAEVELYLEASARDLGAPGFDATYGWGLVDAHGALLLLDIFSDDLESGDTSNWSETVP